MWKCLPISLPAITLLLNFPVLQILEITVLYSHLLWQYQTDDENLSSVMLDAERLFLLLD